MSDLGGFATVGIRRPALEIISDVAGAAEADA